MFVFNNIITYNLIIIHSFNFSGITRLSQPTIIFHIQLHNGNYRTFEVPMAMFHKLRYEIAYLLKEYQSIESRQIMKK